MGLLEGLLLGVVIAIVISIIRGDSEESNNSIIIPHTHNNYNYDNSGFDSTNYTSYNRYKTVFDLEAEQRINELLAKDRELDTIRWHLENGIPYDNQNSQCPDYSNFGIISNTNGPVPTDFLLDDYTKRNNF